MIRLGNISIPKKDFPSLVERHLRQVPRTREIEAEAMHLISSHFSEQLLVTFIKSVCSWGGYPGIGGRVLRQNDLFLVRQKFIETWKILSSTRPDAGEAMNRINEIKNLGSPSFSSKHLRFLYPQLCPVLDSIIREGIGIYHNNSTDYTKWSGDCLEIARNLKQNGILNPMNREAGKWFAADIEMAIFKYLRPT
jgi:hypothetical protein